MDWKRCQTTRESTTPKSPSCYPNVGRGKRHRQGELLWNAVRNHVNEVATFDDIYLFARRCAMSFDYFNKRTTASFFNIVKKLFLRLPQSEETSRMLVTVRCIQWVVSLVENGRETNDLKVFL